jgi:outer membrane murein-binding lipoprotein Lpp
MVPGPSGPPLDCGGTTEAESAASYAAGATPEATVVQSIKLSSFCAAVVLVCAVAGCESNEKDDQVRDKDLERIARQEQRERDSDLDRDLDPVVARDRDRIDDRSASSRPGMKEIPADAQAVDTGEGARLEYEPTRDGVIYVYDADLDRVVYVGRIRERERFRLDPDAGRAQINSRTVFRSDLNPRHRYRLYFDSAK